MKKILCFLGIAVAIMSSCVNKGLYEPQPKQPVDPNTVFDFKNYKEVTISLQGVGAGSHVCIMNASDSTVLYAGFSSSDNWENKFQIPAGVQKIIVETSSISQHAPQWVTDRRYGA